MVMEKDMDTKFDNALTNLHRHIVEDFERYDIRSANANGWGRNPEKVVEFAESLSFEEGRKYIKVTKKLGTQTMVWGFIMKDDDSKFKKGDILKAASWAAPARNKARGNIFGEYRIQWTGPEYL